MIINLIILIATILLGVYFYIKHKYSYWKRKGVPYIEPIIPFGNLPKSKNEKFSTHIVQKYYTELKNKKCTFGGIYFFTSPVVLPIHPELIKNVLVKDFNHFTNRATYFNEEDDPLTGHIFNLHDDKWKNLRSKLTPTFTSGKMKFMFPTIVSVTDEFLAATKYEIKNDPSGEIEIKELLARFTTDVIGTCAFGIDCNSLKNPSAIFRQMGNRIFNTPSSTRTKSVLTGFYPSLARKLHVTSTPRDIADFFMNVVKETVTLRKSNNITRNDFFDLLINLLDKGENGITINDLAAQAFVFFLAGFETSSTTMSFALLEMAQNQKIQDRLREEINKVLENHNGILTYEAMMDMKYLDQVINESLRKWPPGSTTNRVCNKDYKVPDTEHTIEKGVMVFISIYSLHRDPEYYPNPDEFNPDRFSDAEVKKRPSGTFLPFGDGPRNCIGLRFGMMQARLGLLTLVKNFKFTLSSKTQIPIELTTKSIVLSINGGLYLKMEEIK